LKTTLTSEMPTLTSFKTWLQDKARQSLFTPLSCS